ncbi:MAG: HAD family hydrolase [Chlamydiia bacterium]
MFKFLLAGAILLLGVLKEPTPPIKAVIFDFGKVIVHKDKDQILTFLKKNVGVTFEEGIQLIEERKKFLISGGSDKEFFESIFSNRGQWMPENFVKQFHQTWEDALYFDPKVIEIIQSLKGQNKTLILFSNTEKFRADTYTELGYYDPFDMKFLSFEIGLEKPDEEAYKFVIENCGFKPQECLFIDDKLCNIQAAKDLSWHTIHYLNAEQLAADLEKIGLKVDTNPN